MKMIIVLLFLFGAIIFAMTLITSVFNDKINRLEDEVYKLKLDLSFGSDDKVQSNLNIKSSKHSDRSGLPSSWGGMEEYERAPKPWSPFYEATVTVYPKPDNPHKSPIVPKTKKEHCVVIYGDGKEVARYKVDDES